MPTRTDEHETTTKKNDPNVWPDERPWHVRILHAYRRAGVWLGHRFAETRDWAREQRPRMLVQAAVLGTLGLLLAYAALRLVAVLVTGLWSWLFGATAEPAPQPQPDTGSDVPGWIAALDQQPLWTGLWDGITGWFAHQADVTGVPMLALPIAWAVAGALLLFIAAWADARSIGVVAWWGWLAATCWLIWTHTPDGNVIPAATVATVGVVTGSIPLVGFVLVIVSTLFGVAVGIH